MLPYLWRGAASPRPVPEFTSDDGRPGMKTPQLLRKAVLGVTKRTPQKIVDVLYNHRSNGLLRWGRSLVESSLGDTSSGIPVTRGALAGFRLAHSESFGMWVGGHEPAVAREIAKRLAPGAVAFDVGGDIGYTALLLAKAVGPTGKVFVFEPHPDSYPMLVRNISLNQLEDYVEARPVALGSQPGAGTLKLGYEAAVTEVLPDPSGEVTISTLDEEVFERQTPVPDLIVVDTEGAEADVFRGGWRLLQERGPAIIAEHHGERDALAQMLGELGYSAMDIDPSHQFFHRPSIVSGQGPGSRT